MEDKEKQMKFCIGCKFEVGQEYMCSGYADAIFDDGEIVQCDKREKAEKKPQFFKYQDMALNAFKEHVIEVIEEYEQDTKRGEYLWVKPGTGIYGMHIIFRPGAIIIYGDVGCWVFRQYDLDLPWLRGAIGSPGYMFSKLQDGHSTKYDYEATMEYAEECVEAIEDEEKKKEIMSDFKCTSFDIMERAYEFFRRIDSNPEECLRYTWEAEGVHHIWAGLKQFVLALDSR